MYSDVHDDNVENANIDIKQFSLFHDKNLLFEDHMTSDYNYHIMSYRQAKSLAFIFVEKTVFDEIVDKPIGE